MGWARENIDIIGSFKLSFISIDEKRSGFYRKVIYNAFKVETAPTDRQTLPFALPGFLFFS
jgi:hypothetical protein